LPLLSNWNQSDWIALAAVIVAISSPYIHAYLNRVKLKIENKNQHGLTYQPKSAKIQKTSLKHVRHLKISTNRTIAAENVFVFLERVEMLDKNEEWKTVFNDGRLSLKWQYEQDGGKRIGPYVFCNLVRMTKGQSLHFVPQHDTASMADVSIPSTGGSMRAWVQAVGDNGESPVYLLKIEYKGGWAETNEEWAQILTVSGPTPCSGLPSDK